MRFFNFFGTTLAVEHTHDQAQLLMNSHRLLSPEHTHTHTLTHTAALIPALYLSSVLLISSASLRY